ncbi:MAG: putative metal-binding motif-containing protein, partial [Polyangiaceae bacterium]|nr:putative metal-binding motif-containing protein [Polyangiaceae bacterium]
MGGARSSFDIVLNCESDQDCNDGLFCNGEESCAEGRCVAGDALECDDGVECTVDQCSEDERACVYLAPDADGDGFASSSCADAQGNILGADCDDSDPFTFPGSVEVCDTENRDEDCDPSTIGSKDDDSDGYISSLCCNTQNDGDLLCGEDCDDNRTNVNPTATEACDFLDNNCDGETDEGVAIELFADADHDGRGDENQDPVRTCPGAVGYAEVGGDCDDSDPEVFRGQFEICDEKDNNCNDLVDEVRESAPWFLDADGDGYGDPET